jgi:hypothetical protein
MSRPGLVKPPFCIAWFTVSANSCLEIGLVISFLIPSAVICSNSAVVRSRAIAKMHLNRQTLAVRRAMLLDDKGDVASPCQRSGRVWLRHCQQDGRNGSSRLLGVDFHELYRFRPLSPDYVPASIAKTQPEDGLTMAGAFGSQLNIGYL